VEHTLLVKLIPVVNFINILRRRLLYKSAFYAIVTREKMRKALLYKKCTHKMLIKLTPVVNFINILLAPFAPTIFRQKTFAKKLQSQTVIREKLHKILLHIKVEHQMLMKLTPEIYEGWSRCVNCSSGSCLEKTVEYSVRFFIGKQIRWPAVNFINVLCARFLHKVLAPKNYKVEAKLQSRTFQLCNFWRQNIGEKSACKMLMKLTPENCRITFAS